MGYINDPATIISLLYLGKQQVKFRAYANAR